MTKPRRRLIRQSFFFTEDKYHVLSNHTLVIKKLTHMDAGTYVCKVRQRVLSHYTDKTVHLSVQRKYHERTSERHLMNYSIYLLR